MLLKSEIETILGQGEILYEEIQNIAYEGAIFKDQSGLKYRLRVAKKTPKKSGYFVAFWQKINV